jgi:hypothetical protein
VPLGIIMVVRGVDMIPAFWNKGLNQFNLPYDAVRMADDPDRALMEFLVSTYEAAATRGHWDRAALECPFGRADVPRPMPKQTTTPPETAQSK